MAYEHTRGDSWVRSYVFKDSRKKPVDITDMTARMHLRDTAGMLIISALSADGEFTVTGTAGRLDMVVAGSKMNLPIGRYCYDVEVTFADGRILTLDKNKLDIIEDCTHD